MKKNKITTRISLKGSNAPGSLLETLAVCILSAKKLLSDPDVAVFQIDDRTLLEIYGIGFLRPQMIFDHQNPVMNFRVDDLERSVEVMLSAGAKSAEGIIRNCNTFAYCHLQLEEGYVVGLFQEG